MNDDEWAKKQELDPLQSFYSFATYAVDGVVLAYELDVRSLAADAFPDEGLRHLVLDVGPALDLFILFDLGARQRDVDGLFAKPAGLHQAARLQTTEDLVDRLGNLQNNGVRTERAMLQPFDAGLKHKC